MDECLRKALEEEKRNTIHLWNSLFGDDDEEKRLGVMDAKESI